MCGMRRGAFKASTGNSACVLVEKEYYTVDTNGDPVSAAATGVAQVGINGDGDIQTRSTPTPLQRALVQSIYRQSVAATIQPTAPVCTRPPGLCSRSLPLRAPPTGTAISRRRCVRTSSVCARWATSSTVAAVLASSARAVTTRPSRAMRPVCRPQRASIPPSTAPIRPTPRRQMPLIALLAMRVRRGNAVPACLAGRYTTQMVSALAALAPAANTVVLQP